MLTGPSSLMLFSLHNYDRVELVNETMLLTQWVSGRSGYPKMVQSNDEHPFTIEVVF